MPPEKARREDVRAWLLKAELDLKAATHEMSAPDKELSGDITVPRLAQQCETVDATMAAVGRRATGG